MSGIERRTYAREPFSCEDKDVSTAATSMTSGASAGADRKASSQPRDAASAAPPHYGAEEAALAANHSVAPPLSPEECKQLPDAMLDRQASALRGRLSREVSYPERSRDTQELKHVEAELQQRVAAKSKEAMDAHGGVKVCKRVADLPGNSAIGAQHWWIQTTRNEMGMGQVDGKVRGHGESGPPGLATRLVDHSHEPKDNCEVQAGVDEECVDRELQLGKDTGTWIPGVNDCHTVVKDILEECQTNTLEKALEEDTARRLREADAGAN